MEAVIYTRISQDATGEQAGVTRQEAECRELAEREGWTVGRVYSDNDLSASNRRVKRPQFMALVEDMRAGKVPALIVWHTDRLYRRLDDLGELIDAAKDHDVKIRTVKAGTVDLSTASGIMNAEILASVAKHETARMSERIKAQKAQVIAQGGYVGGGRPFGFTKDGTVVPEEAAMLKHAAAVVLSGGSLSKVAREWNEAGKLTVRGNRWNVTSIKRTLVNPRIGGKMQHHGKVVGKSAWPAILDEATQLGLEKLLYKSETGVLVVPERKDHHEKKRKAAPVSSYDLKYQGMGVYICGKCLDVKMVGQPPNESRRMGYSYRCNAFSHLGVDGARLDDFADRVVFAVLSDAGTMAALRRPTEDVVPLRAEAVAVESRLRELDAQFAAGNLSGDQYGNVSKTLNEELARLQDRIDAAGGGQFFEDVEDVEAWWDDRTPSQRSLLMRKLFRIVVLPVGRGGHRKPIEDRVVVVPADPVGSGAFPDWPAMFEAAQGRAVADRAERDEREAHIQAVIRANVKRPKLVELDPATFKPKA